MTREIQAGGEVAADGLREMTTSIEAVHRQIARRAAAPAAHDAIAGGVYAAVRAGLTLGARGAGLLASATSQSWVTPERERAGRIARAALNGAFGDALARRGNALSIPMAVRVGGRDVPLRPDSFPAATPRVAVFVHGLGESDTAWRPDAADGYGARLRADLGFTPVYLRFNSGLPISENGEQMARLLDELVANWPVEVRDLVLIGHSMGALVIRAACHAGARDERAWVGVTRNAVYLGAPHGGAALEKGARLLATTLQRVPETRAVAAAINARSAGIHDLGDGVCGSEHVPLGAGIRHHAVAATIGGHAVLGNALGDLLVRRGSALGRGTRSRPDLAFDAADVHEVANANHFALLCHPAVYEQIRSWLAPADAPVTRRRLLPRRTGATGRRRFA